MYYFKNIKQLFNVRLVGGVSVLYNGRCKLTKDEKNQTDSL